METEKPKIFKALADIMQEINPVGKDQKNTQQNYMFRGIDDVYNAVHPLLKKHRVFMTSKVVDSKNEERTTAKGTVLIYRILKVEFAFFADDGSSVTCEMQGEGMDSGDKASNKAMATAQKYAIIQMFAIPTQEGKERDVEGADMPNDVLLKTMCEEAIRFTESKYLIDWANKQVDKNIQKHPDFVAAVKGQISKLQKMGQ